MKALKYLLAIAVVMVAGATVVAAPALATPNRTDSPDIPARPFFTPIMNTLSQQTGTGNFNFAVPAIGLNINCPISKISGYVAATHTQFRVTQLSAGGAGVICPVVPGGWTLDRTDITCTATSQNPWLFHITQINRVDPTSVTGTLNVTSPCRFSITNAGVQSCVITIDPNQSLPGSYTHINTSMSVNAMAPIVTIRPGVACPWVGSFPATVNATWTLRPDTANDQRMRFTGQSAVAG
jgi:hypothetical protein